jgi:hypothetical protein
MPSPSEERIMNLWLQAASTSDPAKAEPILWEFRNALHEHLDQRRAETEKSLIEVA